MLRHTLIVVMVAGNACRLRQEFRTNPATGAARRAERPLLISPEDLLRLRSTALATGPSITVPSNPSDAPDLRAEVSAVVLHGG